jgi:hydroxymethylpyrimidine/phosphomethylpyrimidine kinase
LRAADAARTFQFAGIVHVIRAQPAIFASCAGKCRREEGKNELNNHSSAAPPIVLVIAGFDPSCGAGIAADLKTISAHNGYGVAAVTALTVQSTKGVLSVHPIAPASLRAQLDALADDVKPSAVKIGMLANRANAVVVAEFLDRNKFTNIVLDPVIKPSSGGVELLDHAGVKYVLEELLKRATVVTPNIDEAALLSGLEIKDIAGMEAAARKLVERGARAVVVKGGHMDKPVDILFDGKEMLTFGGDQVKTLNTHGSGCTFASAIASELASGRPLREAVLLAKTYVQKAIEHGYAIGKGSGPLDHFYRSHQEPALRGIHEVPQHGMHPAAEPGNH